MTNAVSAAGIGRLGKEVGAKQFRRDEHHRGANRRRSEVLRALNPDLDIWDAYATIHLLIARWLDEGRRRSRCRGSEELVKH